ncbi:peptidoglycan editing factor PgeF [Anaerolentibacter hominis]|uniref:peptidoglycan editing factor PgeF n=1 Tax=Anaerolentibacter hominis TaxID=3079009 RepID=UPI0031B7F5C6
MKRIKENPYYPVTYNPEMEEEACLQDGRVPYLYFPALKAFPFLRHGFSTRLGGVSEGIFASMNLGYGRGDEDACVNENYKRIGEAIGFDTKDLIFSDQVHDTKLHVVTAQDRHSGVLQEKKLAGIDGLVTNEPGLVLATTYADCVPLYFVDPVHRAIGLSHSGWKGTVGKIGEKTLEVMAREFGTRPEEVTVLIGPSICASCYEVGEEVAEQFRRAFPGKSGEGLLFAKGDGKYQLDLWLACKHTLEEAGVPAGQIKISEICTCHNPELLYSHRASHGQRGSLMAFLEIIRPES